MDSSVDSAFDISSSSFVSGLHAAGGSTPKKAPRKSRVLAVRKQSPVVGTCHLCGKVYRSEKYFQKHKIDHKLKGKYR